MSVDIEKELTFVRNLPGFGQYLGRALRGIVDAVNGLSQNISADSTSTLPPPPTIQQLQVKTDGNGNVHATINDSNPIQKNLSYFVEYDTDSSFTQPHVEELKSGRTMRPMPLPAFDDNGNPQSWHFRAYSQYQGGKPGQPVNFGGTSATPVSVGGTARLTLLPSTGSGTASPSGQQGGSGMGKTLFRAAQGPKRKSTTPGT
jgi:hypothetical protein